MLKRIALIVAVLLVLIIAVFLGYGNNTSLANAETVAFYNALKKTLTSKGYSDNLLVISTKRFKWHNNIQVKISGAAQKSRHLEGEAIDFLVFDVNGDGSSNGKDVDIVSEILDKEIIKDKGGIGTYKNENIFSRQMVHIDSKGVRARWNR